MAGHGRAHEWRSRLTSGLAPLSPQLLGLKERDISLERCRLVKYDEYSETLDQSFEFGEVGEGEEGGEGGERWEE